MLEKALMIYEQDNDTLPLLNETEELVSNTEINLIRMVSAETTNDMITIYESLQTTLDNYDEEEYLYRIDLSKTEEYISNLKYGHKQSDKDFYVYSTKTNNAFHLSYGTFKV